MGAVAVWKLELGCRWGGKGRFNIEKVGASAGSAAVVDCKGEGTAAGVAKKIKTWFSTISKCAMNFTTKKFLRRVSVTTLNIIDAYILLSSNLVSKRFSQTNGFALVSIVKNDKTYVFYAIISYPDLF